MQAGVLEVLASDKDERVRSCAASNPSTPAAVLEVLASDKDEGRAHRRCQEPLDAGSSAGGSGQGYGQFALLPATRHAGSRAGGSGQRQGRMDVRSMAASNRSTPAAVLEALAGDKDVRVRSSAARLPPATAWRRRWSLWPADKSERVRSCAARNPSTPAAVLEVLASDTSEWVRSSAASNPSTPAAVLEVLARDE